MAVAKKRQKRSTKKLAGKDISFLREAAYIARRAADRDPRVVGAFMGQAFTKVQGQYLSFIAMYTKLHRRPPAEADIQAYFQVTPPSVHNMIVTLERRGLIAKTPGTPRSIRVLVGTERLPPLE